MLPSRPVLQIERLTAGYGTLIAVRDISITVGEGETVGVLGVNGSGKSTLLMAVAGLVSKRAGRVTFQGTDATHARAESLVERGMALVPEGRHVFGSLSVEQNLDLGRYARRAGHPRALMDGVFDLFPRLRERRHQASATLSGGEQQMLAIGRALMGQPTMLLIDEPSMGLAPIVIDVVFDAITRLKERGTTLLIVEQSFELATSVADRIVVMGAGSEMWSGPARSLTSERLSDLYLLGANA